MIGITIHENVTPTLRDMEAQLRRPRALFQAVAKEVIKTFTELFRKLQSRGNKRGWPDRHFWFGLGTSGSVSSKVGVTQMSDRGATVSVSDYRYVHKVTGGLIVPKRAKALTIPLNAKAYKLGGKGTLRESAPFLKLLVTTKGAWLVRETLEKTKRKIGGRIARRSTLEFWFRLVGAVNQRAEVGVEPKKQDIVAAIEKAAAQAGPRLLKLEQRHG